MNAHAKALCYFTQFPGSLSIIQALLLGGGGALAHMTFLILEALNFMKLHACFPVTSQSLQTSGYSFLLVLLQLRDAELDLLFEGLLASCG